MKRRTHKKSNISQPKNKKRKEINKSNSYDKIYSNNVNARKNLNCYKIIDIIDLTSSNSVEKEKNIKNMFNPKKAKNKKKSKIKETIINLDEDENGDSIQFDFKKKNKINKKIVKRKASKKNQKKKFTKFKNEEIITVYSLSDSEMNSSFHNFSKNIKSIGDSINNFESNFINFSLDSDFNNNVYINLEKNKNSIINNELIKFLSKKRGKEESETEEEEERVIPHSKKEKEKQMANFSKIKMPNNRNYPKSYSNEKCIDKNMLSKKENIMIKKRY